jgi:hypothetical protein
MKLIASHRRMLASRCEPTGALASTSPVLRIDVFGRAQRTPGHKAEQADERQTAEHRQWRLIASAAVTRRTRRRQRVDGSAGKGF